MGSSRKLLDVVSSVFSRMLRGTKGVLDSDRSPKRPRLTCFSVFFLEEARELFANSIMNSLKTGNCDAMTARSGSSLGSKVRSCAIDAVLLLSPASL